MRRNRKSRVLYSHYSSVANDPFPQIEFIILLLLEHQISEQYILFSLFQILLHVLRHMAQVPALHSLEHRDYDKKHPVLEK